MRPSSIRELTETGPDSRVQRKQRWNQECKKTNNDVVNNVYNNIN